MTTDATGVHVIDHARRDLGALPLPTACGERAGVRGIRMRCAQSAPHPTSLVAAPSRPLPASGARALQAPAPCAGKPDEGACGAHFPLTRVTRIFQKSVLTKIAPVDEGGTPPSCSLSSASARCRVGPRNATTAGKKRPSDQLACFRPVLYRDWHNSRACRRPSWLGAQR
jgi:hypothetical protein